MKNNNELYNKEFNDKLKENIDLSKIKNFSKMLEELIIWTIKCRNSNKRIKCLPIISFIYEKKDNDEIDVLSVNINYKWHGGIDDPRKFFTHSESLCLEEINKLKDIKSRNLNLLISTQPCINCLRKIKDFNFIEINYIFSKKYSMKNEWNETIMKNNINLKKINIDKYKNSIKVKKIINSILK